MTKRYLVGGPPNSGKSTYVLSVVQRLGGGHGVRARAVELDVWSGSYPAFRGEVSFKDRPKKFGLDWDWKTPLDQRLAEFNGSDDDYVFGDLPGAKIDEATHYMCDQAKADGAIVVSRTLEGLVLWRQAFEAHNIPIVHECLSMQGQAPLVLRDMHRGIDAAHPDVAFLASAVVANNDAGDGANTERQRSARRRFKALFRQNYSRRSRTAHGRDENLGGPAKKPLCVSGEELKRAAMRNGERLLEDVLATPRPAEWTAQAIRERCERWFDIVNDGICGPQWYEEEFGMLQRDAALITRARGTPVGVNARYRLWTPEHTVMKVSPLLLEEQMDAFYSRVAELVARAEVRFPSWGDTIEALAYADLMTDGEIRPWLDGCGRMATALVMWIAHLLGAPLPLFAASKEVHKMSMRDFDRHRLYFLECIRRAELEHP